MRRLFCFAHFLLGNKRQARARVELVPRSRALLQSGRRRRQKACIRDGRALNQGVRLGRARIPTMPACAVGQHTPSSADGRREKKSSRIVMRSPSEITSTRNKRNKRARPTRNKIESNKQRAQVASLSRPTRK